MLRFKGLKDNKHCQSRYPEQDIATSQAMSDAARRPKFGEQSLHEGAFIKPISVKSKDWSSKKVNIGNVHIPTATSTGSKARQGGPDNAPAFAKYAAQKPVLIAAPKNKSIYNTHTYEHYDTQQVEKKTKATSQSGSRENTPDANDEHTKKMIQELLKPQKYEKVDIDPAERKVEGLEVQLLDHQVAGLKFLLHREKAIAKKRSYLIDYYGETENQEEETCFNKGGLLADDMGLGKTVQMLALILSNRPKKKTTKKTTLVVCPASLVVQWCNEIEEKAPSLTVLSYHGPKRPKDPEIVHKYDVVVTSYPTLSSEFEKFKTPLYDSEYPFRRIILDEAHIIKNRDTRAHQSCFALSAERRWCLTGTPIQNKLDELYSLFRFLGVNKYEDSQIWGYEIGPLVTATSRSAEALALLHSMLKKFMVRRTKQILIESKVLTVSKKYHIELLEFTPFETKLYKKLNEKIIKSIIGSNITLDEFNSGTLNTNGDTDFEYMSILTKLLRLRQLCCSWEILFNLKKTSELALKSATSKNLDNDIDSLTYDVTKSMKSLKMSEQDDVTDDKEIMDILGSLKGMHLEKAKAKEKEKESNDTKNVENEADEEIPDIKPSLHTIKVQRVINILKKDDRKKPRKTIIFSEFTSMLDILMAALFENKIKFVRYDGTMDKKSKEEALEKLKTDSKVHVLLCSLKCGAYGLNITSCSRVILYEPFWNPAIGAQAVDRAYRIGQKSDVEIHEFFIADTIEMRIKELQEKKKLLMKAVVDKDPKSAIGMLGNGLSKAELLGLFGIKIQRKGELKGEQMEKKKEGKDA